MTQFLYRGMGASGKLETGVIEADSKQKALGILRHRNIEPLELQNSLAQNDKVARFWQNSPLRSAAWRSLFYKQLSMLLEAGIAPVNALRMLAKQSRKSKEASYFDVLATSVSEGKKLSAILRLELADDAIFEAGAIEVGENAGSLVQALRDFHARYLPIALL